MKHETQYKQFLPASIAFSFCVNFQFPLSQALSSPGYYNYIALANVSKVNFGYLQTLKQLVRTARSKIKVSCIRCGYKSRKFPGKLGGFLQQATFPVIDFGHVNV